MIDTGHECRFDVTALEVRIAAAPAQDLCSARPGIGDLIFYDFYLLRKSHGANIDTVALARLLCIRALAKSPGLLDDATDEIVGHSLFDINTLDRDTDLAGIGEGTPNRGIGRSFEVGITQYNHRV